jgi:hypothetical protein
MVIFVLFPLCSLKISNRMEKAGQIVSMDENRSARMKDFGVENRMGGHGLYVSSTGSNFVAGFIGHGDELSVYTKISKYLRSSSKQGLFPRS